MNALLKSTILMFSVLATVVCNAQTNQISLERKVAQMLILGIKGTEVSDSSEIVRAIRDKGIGGVILFEHNISPIEDSVDSKGRLRQLCADLQAISADKLIISIDQEGGKVNRMKFKYGFPESVRAQYLGEINNEDSSRYYYSRMAEQLKNTGINVNFAPIVDLNVNPECPVIGANGRSYGASVGVVNQHAQFFIEEHHRFGVKTSLKHFPGHGSSVTDSHLGFTDITNTWTDKELKPYRHLIKKSLCDMVMVSHTFNSHIDSIYPASLSRLTVDSLLRKEIGYNGIAVTDDMNMKAITSNYSFEEAMTLTINAGMDLIIISADKRSAQDIVEIIVNLVEQGKISIERIDESYNRIIRFREGLNICTVSEF